MTSKYKGEDNLLTPLVSSLQHMWRHRRGYEQVGSILDTLDALPQLMTKSGLRPVVSHKQRTDYGWRLCVTLPPGVKSRDLLERLDYFSEQAEAVIQAYVTGKTVVMDVYNKKLENRVVYDYTPSAGLYCPIPIGQSLRGFIEVDLAELPNLFIGGMPGMGKSNAMRTIATSLITHNKSRVAIIDLKRLDYVHLEGHALIAYTLPQALKVLEALNKEMERRIEILSRARCSRIQEYRGDNLPYVVLIVDELAELSDKTCQGLLNRLTRLARASGISTIAGTQRPSATIYPNFTDTRAMFSGVLCFKVKDETNSRMLLDNELGAKIPKVKGRAIWQYQEDIEVQVPLMSNKKLMSLLSGIERRGDLDQSTKRLPTR